MARKWTDDEIELLMEYAKEIDDCEIAFKLNRTEASVKVKRTRLKISHNTSWTKDQVFLLKNSNNTDIVELSKLLGKSISSIKNKRHILGIKIGRNKYSEEDFRQICNEYSPESTYLDNYINEKGAIMLKLECKCGDIFTVEKYDIINRGRVYCKKCLSLARKGIKVKFKDEYDFVKTNSNCILLDVFHKNDDPINGVQYKLVCECKNVFKLSKNSFINTRNTCRQCMDEMKRKERYKGVLSQFTNDGFKLITNTDSYKNGASKLIVKDFCGYLYETTFYNYKNNSKLMKFGSKNKFTIQNIMTYLKLNCTEYTLLSNEYISATEYLEFRCDNGHEFKMSWCRFQEGARCKYCCASAPEIVAHEVLRKNNIIFETEYTFDGMVNPKTNYSLRVDIVILDDCGNVIRAIEINGKHHYEPVLYYTNDKTESLKYYNNTVYRDSIKINFLKNNIIDCIIIPYWDFNNIEEILTKELNLNNTTINTISTEQSN